VGDSKRSAIRKLKLAVAVAAAVLSPSALYAQSCVMCYQSAAASGPRTIHALKAGILILMFPPVLITAGIVYLAYSRREKFNENV
ncbi:MAG: hypothetical protein WA774_07085, partial [Candidatus Acidiferrales bacterium]